MIAKVEMLKHPTDEDWLFCKQCTLNTIGKTTTQLPTQEWKEKLLIAEHSPIRTLWFAFKMEIPYWVSVHYVRHKYGVEHYIQSQRDDRQDKYNRNEAPQGQMVTHIMYINAQELMFMSRRRYCMQAAKETREVMREIGRKIEEQCPYMVGALEPMCYYRGGRCTEFNPCGYNKTYKEGY